MMGKYKILLPKTEKKYKNEIDAVITLVNMDKIIMFSYYKEITKVLNFSHSLKCRGNCAYPHCKRAKNFFKIAKVFAKLIKEKNIRKKTDIILILSRMIEEEKQLRLKINKFQTKKQKKTFSGYLYYMHQHLTYCREKCNMPFCPNFKCL